MASRAHVPDKTACPSGEVLAQLGLGQLAPEDLELWAGHVESCAECLATLNGLSVGDTLSDAMRQANRPIDTLQNPAMQAVMEQLRGLGAAVGDATADSASPSATSPLPNADDFRFLAPPESADELGRLGPYRVLNVLGRGGMGLVFLAEDVQLRRKVALKVMLPGQAATKTACDRFLREARMAAAIENDHIVHINQVGEDRDVPFLAMQLLKGESLEARLRRDEKLPARDVIHIGREIALGLAAAHEHGLIHRDIKPANIWLESKDEGGRIKDESPGTSSFIPHPSSFRVKILDFGLARAVTTDVQITQSGAILGTPAYMAPEQAAGQPVDARCDLFSLGCVLYRLATGVSPFHRPELTATLLALAMNDPPVPSACVPELPADLSDLIMALLQKDPAKRPASAHVVVEKLKQMEANLRQPVAAAPATATELLGHASPPSGPMAAAARAKTRRPMLVALALLFLIGGGLAVYQLIFRTSDGTLIVEVDGDADVRFQKGKLNIYDADGKFMYALKPSEKNKTLPPGKYLIDVAGADGLNLSTDKFEITNNNRTVKVRVTVEAAMAAKVTDPERKAVEWLLAAGGKVFIDIPSNRLQIFAMRDLPTGPLPATSVVFENNDRVVTESGLEHLKAIKNLHDLTVVYAGVSDAWLKHIGMMTTLNAIYLSGNQVSAAGIAHLKTLTNLTSLGLGDTPVDDAGLAHLKTLTNLKTLALHQTRLTDACLQHLRPLIKLSSLDLRGTKITDAGLVHLKGLTKLNWLHLQKTEVTADGVKKLSASLPDCTIKWDGPTIEPRTSADPERFIAEWLVNRKCLIQVKPTDGKPNLEVTAAAQLPKTPFRIMSVTVPVDSGWKWRDEDLEQLARLTALQSLHVALPSEITDAGVERLTQSPSAAHLDFVEFDGSNITDAGVAHFRRCPELHTLRLFRCKVSDHVLDKLQGFGKLRFFGFTGPNLTDTALDGIGRFPNLEGLEVSSPKITDATVAKLVGMKLTYLNLNESVQVTGAGMRHVKKLAGLRNLGLTQTSIDDAGLEELADLPELRFLSLPHTKVTDAGMKTLARFPKLQGLWLDGLPISDAGLANLKKASSLHKLWLSSTKITDAGLPHLAALGKLTELNLTLTKVTADGVKKLAAALPACKIEWDGPTIEPSTSPELERKAAEWVLSAGGWIWLNEKDAPLHKAITSTKDLPAGPLLITGVAFNDNSKVTNADLERLKPLTNLTNLGLHTLTIDDAGLAHLRPLTKLRDLRIADCPITDAGLVYLKGFVELHSLALIRTQITDDGLQQLKELRKLSGYFDLTGTATGDKALELLQAQPRFTIFSAGKNFTNDGLRRLRTIQPELSQLGLRGTKVTDAGLEVLKGWDSMTTVELGESEITSVGLEHLAGLKNLTYVGLAYTKLTDAGMVHFKGWNRITLLDLHNTSITDAGLKHLAGLKTLKWISVKGVKVTAEGVAALHKAVPGCQVDWDGPTIEPKMSSEQRPQPE